MFGLSSREDAFIQTTVIAPLQARGAKVFCYGSRARGDHKPFSDLDLMVEATEDLTALVSDLQDRLRESNFPYKVDLVELRHFAKSYMPDYLRDRQPYVLDGTPQQTANASETTDTPAPTATHPQ